MTSFLRFISWLAVLALWGCTATVFVDSSVYGKYFAPIGLAFPFCVAAVVGCIILCLLFKPRLTWIGVLGLIACCGSLRDYAPINLSSPAPKGAIKVLSYNIMNWNNWAMTPDSTNYETIQYLTSQKPDIACLQEITFKNEEEIKRIDRIFSHAGYKLSCDFVGGNRIGIITKWPVIKSQVITHSEGNGAIAFYLEWPRRGDTLIVITAHLESMHLSQKERDKYHTLVKRPEEADTIHGKLDLIRKIAQSGTVRARQADTLSTFVDQHRDTPLILMGDFNDTPISYAHHKICSRLTDCYRATANGIGRSFNRDAIYVRIDNIFCSSHFKPFAVRVDDTVPFSDHYPIIGYLKPVKRK